MRLVLMGPAGSGKTVLGNRVAAQLGASFVDGDSLHSAGNINKMEAGLPLTDADRLPWLDRIATILGSNADANRTVIVGCSALKRSYRDRLRTGDPKLKLVLLNAPLAVLQDRVSARTGHYMPANLVRDQCQQLELPAPDEDALILDATEPLSWLADAVARWLASRDKDGS
jgi:gluconokinase